MNVVARYAARATAIGVWCIAANVVLAPESDSAALAADPIVTAFARFAPHVSARVDGSWVVVESDGMPHAPLSHPIMEGIRRWQQQVPLPQPYRGDNAWRIPREPRIAAEIVSAKTQLRRGAIAIAVNGVPIFNALNNRGEDAYRIGELDEFGGHCGRADDYHYHIAPLALLDVVGKESPLAFSLDGFPILAPLTGRYGAPCALNGIDPLDECAGHLGRGSEGSSGLYHYHASATYPYIQGGIRGVVTVEDDQIVPQPRARSFRPALTALKGARTTNFAALSESKWRLDYEINGVEYAVEYSLRGDASEFAFLGPGGDRRVEQYSRHDGATKSEQERGVRNGVGDPSMGPVGGDPRRPWLSVHADEIDTDRDGAVTRAELQAEIDRAFGGFDSNLDGELDARERDANPPLRSALVGFLRGHASELDGDADGSIDHREFEDRFMSFFEREDTDGDGVLSTTELEKDPALPFPQQRAPNGGEGEWRGRAKGRDKNESPESFRTAVPAHPFDLLLAAPTERSVVLSVLTPRDTIGFVEYGVQDSEGRRRTRLERARALEPMRFELTGLSGNAAFTYRFRYCADDGKGLAPPDAFEASEWYTFRTPRAKDREFRFTVIADSHLDENMDIEVYRRTLDHVRAAAPDLHFDLGDTFMTDKYPRFEDALPHYLAQRYYFGLIGASIPPFLVLGNHDGEGGDRDRAMVDWARSQRTRFFPPPPILPTSDPGAHGYTGRTAATDLDGAHYYAFEWGDATFIVLDPYGLTKRRVRGGGRNAELPPAERLTDESWSRTLGEEQYDWLTTTLEGSRSRYLFVFLHHLVGGFGSEARGGAEAAPYFEWGGRAANGADDFQSRRPNWEMPIHDLLVKHGVSAVFHGHDHLYVHSALDGLVYQCVPQPGNERGGTRSAADYGYESGTILPSPGHLRVTVGRDEARVELIRTALAKENDGTIADTYTISPRRERD